MSNSLNCWTPCCQLHSQLVGNLHCHSYSGLFSDVSIVHMNELRTGSFDWQWCFISASQRNFSLRLCWWSEFREELKHHQKVLLYRTAGERNGDMEGEITTTKDNRWHVLKLRIELFWSEKWPMKRKGKQLTRIWTDIIWENAIYMIFLIIWMDIYDSFIQLSYFLQNI